MTNKDFVAVDICVVYLMLLFWHLFRIEWVEAASTAISNSKSSIIEIYDYGIAIMIRKIID